MSLLHQLSGCGLFEAEYQAACCSFLFSLPPWSSTTYAGLNWRCSEAAFSLFSEQAKVLHLLCPGRSSTSQVAASWLMTVLLDLLVPHLGLDSHICNRTVNFPYPVWVAQPNLGVTAPPAVTGERRAPPGSKSGHRKVSFGEGIWRTDPSGGAGSPHSKRTSKCNFWAI